MHDHPDAHHNLNRDWQHWLGEDLWSAFLGSVALDDVLYNSLLNSCHVSSRQPIYMILAVIVVHAGHKQIQ
jgi:hypothetical protein